MIFKKGDKVRINGVNHYSMTKELKAHKENKTIGTIIMSDFVNGEYVVDFDSSTHRIKKQYIEPAPGFKL